MEPRASLRLSPLVLIVDDHPDARDLYSTGLRLSGFRTAAAVDGADAVEKASELRPAAIVMDLSMPRMDGCEATRRIKADPTTRHIPVVALTGAQYSRDAALGAGCCTYLTKPCEPAAVAAVIRGVLQPSSGGDAPA